MGVPQPASERGVYGISVAADLVGMGVQNLRMYEARGLLEPERTDGGTRRYSAEDLDRLRRIADLLEAGLNLAGIGMVLNLEAENTELRAQIDETDSSSRPHRPHSKRTRRRSPTAPSERESPRASDGSHVEP